MKAVITNLVAVLLVQASLVLSWDRPKVAAPDQFPHQVAIMWKPSVAATHFTSCSGSILSEVWILTSAYCISYQPNLGYNFIKAGAFDVNVDDEHVQKLEIEGLIVHEKYPGRSPVLSNLAYYDIGLIKTKTPLVFNDRVRPIKLPRANNWLKGSHKLEYNLVLSGWGMFAYHLVPDKPTVMRTVSLPVVPNKVCTESIRTIFAHITLSDMQMCTRPLDGNIAACIGNYGGPVIQYDSDNEAVLVGIYGWTSTACNTNGMPPVYTRVGYFVNWIKNKIKP